MLSSTQKQMWAIYHLPTFLYPSIFLVTSTKLIESGCGVNANFLTD